MKEAEKSTLSKLGLKSRLWLAFTFATFFPTAILFYYWFNSYTISFFTISVIIFIILVGWGFVVEIFLHVLRIYSKTEEAVKQIEKADKVKTTGIKNEVERLDVVFSMLSSKVKESVEELRIVSSKTEELSKAIAQKVRIFSSILEANSLFSKGAPSEDILQFLIERLREIVPANISFIFFVKDTGSKSYRFFSGIEEDKILYLVSEENIKKIKHITTRCVVDDSNRNDELLFIREILGVNNFIVQPIYLRESIVGFIVVGNRLDNFVFSKDDSDAVNLFSYNMSIVWERKNLYKKVEDLEILDPLTGIYNDKFFLNRLEEEVKRATTYQRPCGLLVIEIGNYNEYREKLGFLELERLLKKLVNIFKDNVRPIDILGRIRENRFGIILIERNKRQSHYVGVRLKEVIYSFLEENVALAPRVSLAVAENPIDGASAQELLDCIHAQLKE